MLRIAPKQNGGTIREEREESSSSSQDLNGIDADLEDHKAEEEVVGAADREGEVDADENCVTDSQQHKNNNLIIHAS